LVLVRSVRPYLVNERDRALLDMMIDRRLASSAAALDDLASELGAEGRTIHALATNRDRDRFPSSSRRCQRP
jgi:hypothetical protein